MNLPRRLLAWLGAVRGWFGATIFLGMLGASLAILHSYLLATIVDSVFLQGASLSQVIPCLLMIASIIAFRAIVQAGTETTAARLSGFIQQKLRAAILTKIDRLGPAFTLTQESGPLALMAIEGIDRIGVYFSAYLPQLILAVVVPLITLAIVFPIDLTTALILLFTAPLIPAFMILIGKAAENATRKQWTSLSRMSAFFSDTLRGVMLIKSLGAGARISERVFTVGEDYRRETLSVLKITFLSALALEWVATLSTAVIAVQVGLRLLANKMEFLPAFFLILIAPEFYQSLRLLGARFHAGMAGVQSAAHVFSILDMPEQHSLVIIDPVPEKPICISFSKVSYRYADRQANALEDISLELRQGRMTALVGPSGSGKSTLAWLVMKFIEPNSGEITVDGMALSCLDGQTWRDKIAWVPQRSMVPMTTVRDYLLAACPNAEDTALIDALKHVGAKQMLQQRNGLDTTIGEGGVGVSGGQMQRLSLARALLKNAPILILDEPTAHLDPVAEKELVEVIHALIKNRIALVIAHRHATIQAASAVCFLDHGRIVSLGTPDEVEPYLMPRKNAKPGAMSR
jgi:ATP-binding cassette subfamily C protein CydD